MILRYIRWRWAWWKWFLNWPGYSVTTKLDPASRRLIQLRHEAREPQWRDFDAE